MNWKSGPKRNDMWDRLLALFGVKPEPSISPVPEGSQPTPAPTPNYPQIITQGMQRFLPDNPPPAATMGAQLAQAGRGLPDPLLPAIVALMESGGGANMKGNNMFNIGPGVSYPDLQTAIIGGGPDNQRGMQGLLRPGGLYDTYRNSGRLEDFFNTFTPPGPEHGNPSMEELIQRYNALKLLFQ